MQRIRLSVTILWLFGAVACKPSGTAPTATEDAAAVRSDVEPNVASSIDASASKPSSDDAGAVNDASVDAGSSADASTTLDPKSEIQLHHGACFGDCPELWLKLRADGTFTGRSAPKALDPATTQELFALADKAFNPPPRCPPGPTDIQYTTTTFVHDGKKHTAKHPRGAPCSKALSELEKHLEAIR